ncbi:double zinc ribbon domain-containing protein [Marinitoga lauensis]|uniref:double zinc ribbon domain-containing protein n=1 Tax=Marinitoga lauensis TaxID=2201189 RepID=UPI0014055E22|nr:zinc ribbon domain-containing protein [Marinitoga lauensis]
MSIGIKICPNCGEIVENDEKICPNCDSFFLTKKCPRCDEIMKDDVKKCWNCGWDFGNKKKRKNKKQIFIKYMLKKLQILSLEKHILQIKKLY